MKKLLTLAGIAASLSMLTPVAQAASVTSNFDVTATLTPSCVLAATWGSTGATGALNFGAVTAFAAPATPTPSDTMVLKCSRSFTGTGILAQVNATVVGGGSAVASGAAVGPSASTATDATGILPNGLFYTVDLAVSVVAGGLAPTAVTTAAGTDADRYTITLTGSMPAQAGANAGANFHTRTIQVDF